jgi:hypothetical protein
MNIEIDVGQRRNGPEVLGDLAKFKDGAARLWACAGLLVHL